MSLLSTLSVDENIQAQGDKAGGFTVLESGVYGQTIELAYLGESKGGAMSLNLSVKDDKGMTHRHTLWMTSGTAKGKLNYYIDSNKVKRYLPGFEVANDLVRVTLNKAINELTTETKTINLYSTELKKEVPTQVPMIVDLLGQQFKAGIRKIVENKTVQTRPGVYEPTADIRETNEIVKVFRADDGMTAQEIVANDTETQWINKWTEMYTGVDIDKTVKDPSKLVATTAPGAAGGAKPKTSMFGNPTPTDAATEAPKPSGMFSTPAEDAQSE